MNALQGTQSALHPQSQEASAIADLAWLLAGGATAIFVLVLALAAIALWRRPRWLARRSAIVAGGIVFPLLVLGALLAFSMSRLRATAPAGEAAVRIEVTGQQWWWRVRYLTAAGEVDFETANELRVPLGAPVEIALVSDDVLHSFWVPNLAGKLDLVPGRVNRLRFTPTGLGRWRGQCAEYCGSAHARMAFHVVVLPDEGFRQWVARQRAPASGPLPAAFATYCAVCHTVRGTPARGRRGPDLTHVGSRVSLAAGLQPNDPAMLAAWIVSAQRLKPGSLMPSFAALSAAETSELVHYLAGLE